MAIFAIVKSTFAMALYLTARAVPAAVHGNGPLLSFNVGSKCGCEITAIACALIGSAQLNGVDPQAWLAWVLGRMADQKVTRLDELFLWRNAVNAA